MLSLSHSMLALLPAAKPSKSTNFQNLTSMLSYVQKKTQAPMTAGQYMHLHSPSMLLNLSTCISYLRVTQMHSIFCGCACFVWHVVKHLWLVKLDRWMWKFFTGEFTSRTTANVVAMWSRGFLVIRAVKVVCQKCQVIHPFPVPEWLHGWYSNQIPDSILLQNCHDSGPNAT